VDSTPLSLVDRLRQQASDLGFHLFGVAPAVAAPGYAGLLRAIEAGYLAEMDYVARRQSAYAHPRGVFPPVRSLIVLGFPYRTEPPQSPATDQGRVARYAWGEADYHDLIHPRLKQLRQSVREAAPDADARGVVDTAPLLEREFAQLAGLGWRGKNTLLLNKWEGSYFFLACLLTNLDLPVDMPHASDHCGTCRRCLDACPTDAFVEPYVLDSRRCISYLTIEHPGVIPAEVRAKMGDWLFGCDVCQDVCPWNRRGSATHIDALQPRPALNPVSLPELFELDDASFRARFRKSPLWRSRRRGILRNAAICLGNGGDPTAIPALCRGLSDPEPLVRGAAAWALGQIGGRDAASSLRHRQACETAPDVFAELQQALDACAEDGEGRG
jgi:epoxyqueuosine reductase